jgi:hypothetical protein
MAIQMDLFEKDTIEILRREIAELRKEVSNTRRGLFQRFGDLSNKVMNLTLENDRLRARLSNLEGSRYNSGLDGLLDHFAVQRVYGTPQLQRQDPSGIVDYSGLPLFALRSGKGRSSTLIK